MRILYVEDEPNDYIIYIRAVTAEANRRGGTLDHAPTLEDALRQVQAGDYDVIVLDLNIPLGEDCRPGYVDSDLNGLYLLGYLKDQGNDRTRVVCLTNYMLRARTELEQFPRIKILPKSCTRDAVVKAVFP